MAKRQKHEAQLAAAHARIHELTHKLEECMAHAWTLQMVLAATLVKATEHASIVLSLDERKAALDGEWGISTDVLPDPAQPMIVRVMREIGGVE